MWILVSPCFVVLLYGGDFSFLSLFAGFVRCGVSFLVSLIQHLSVPGACFVVVLLARVLKGLRDLLKFVSFGKSGGTSRDSCLFQSPLLCLC